MDSAAADKSTFGLCLSPAVAPACVVGPSLSPFSKLNTPVMVPNCIPGIPVRQTGGVVKLIEGYKELSGFFSSNAWLAVAKGGPKCSGPTTWTFGTNHTLIARGKSKAFWLPQGENTQYIRSDFILLGLPLGCVERL